VFEELIKPLSLSPSKKLFWSRVVEASHIKENTTYMQLNIKLPSDLRIFFRPKYDNIIIKKLIFIPPRVNTKRNANGR
jgi:hypothetical protein